MTKKRKIIIAFGLIGILATGCSQKNSVAKTNPPSDNNINSYRRSGEQTQPSDNNEQSSQNNDGKKPSTNQSWDYANGFSIKELESALRATGAINTSGEPYDVSGTNMTEATRYGNIVIGSYNWDLVDEALALYQKGSMEIHGKKVKVVNMIGNYLLIVLEGDISQEAISAFSAVGGL